MKDDLVRFSASIDWELLKEFDEIIEKEGFSNRSLAIRTLIEEYVNEHKQKTQDSAFVTLVVSDAGISCQKPYLCYPLNNGESLYIFLDENHTKLKETLEFLKNKKQKYLKVVPIGKK